MEFVYVPGLANQISKQNYPEPVIIRAKKKPHLSPSQSPVIIYGAIDPPRYLAEPPEVRNDRKRDDSKEDGLGALREATRGEDKVVEYVGCHQNGKVERRELSYRC